MSKALTKEDLIYILQSVLKLSQDSDNALHRASDDGLYVKDYANDLRMHVDNASMHVTQNILDVLSHISIDANDELIYNGKQLVTYISKDADNAIIQKDDGLYAPAFKLSKKANNALILEADGLYNKNTDASSHINDHDIHVTKIDKDNWDGMLRSANDYTNQEIDKLPVRNFCFVTSLPESNQDEKMLYLLADDPSNLLGCTYTAYIYYNNAYHNIGITKQELSHYITTDQFAQALTMIAHNNQSVLDKLSEDASGALCYNGQNIFNNALVSTDPFNAIVVKDGKLYAKDYGKEIESIEKGASLAKVNLYNEEISQSGKYSLKDSIDNYNLILVEYYYKPDKQDKGTPGCIQTAVIDPDTLNEAYSMGMLYILQYGYGTMTSNSQIHIVKDKLTVDYYHNVCIYKITGIKKGDDENGGSATK